MEREEIKNRVVDFFRRRLPLLKDPSPKPQIQMGDLYHLFDDSLKGIPGWQQNQVYTIIREIVQEFINNGLLYPGLAGDFNSGYPWLTITEFGKEAFTQDDWLPYDPDGYLKALKTRVPEIDDITFAYVGESVSTFNRGQLLSATITLGVASENLMLLLIEAYLGWMSDQTRKAAFEKKIKDRSIYTQYREFKQEFEKDVKNIPKDLQANWETYLDGIFNFIRLNRNSAGHPTGKQLSAKTVYANLQIFADYAQYIFDLIKFFS